MSETLYIVNQLEGPVATRPDGTCAIQLRPFGEGSQGLDSVRVKPDELRGIGRGDLVMVRVDVVRPRGETG